jgi:hypothetical protein
MGERCVWGVEVEGNDSHAKVTEKLAFTLPLDIGNK